MKILEIILSTRTTVFEAKPDNLGQGLLDKIFAVYQKRDINDTTIPKFNSGLEIANYMFKYSGPQKLIWTAKQYTIDQHFFLHDLANWKNIFDLFDRPDIKQRLEQKDINQYKSIDELKSVIRPLVQQRENMTAFDHILEAVDKFVKKGEAEWLYRGPEYSIYHPRTFYSSNVLLDLYGGKNQVDVCTVTGKNMFTDFYAPNGYLIYTLTPDDFFVAYINHDVDIPAEFSNKTNDHDNYGLDYQLEHFKPLKQIFRTKLTKKTSLDVQLKLEPDTSQHLYLCMDAVNDDGWMLQYVPLEYRTHRICYDAVSNDGVALKFVPKTVAYYDKICDQAVKNEGMALDYVPKHLITREMCVNAVYSNPGAIRLVPDDLIDEEMCKLAVSYRWDTLSKVPERLKTFEVCRLAFKGDPEAADYFPDKFKTPDQMERFWSEYY